MNIAKFCIRHKVTTLLAVIMIAVFGVVYTTQLQMALLPNIEYPAAYVYCYYNGAGPEDIEQLVTRPLESAIMSVPGVDSVTSSSADSISTIQIMYVENTDVDIAATKLREKFDALSLPDGCGSPVILNINVSEMMPSAIVGLLGDDLAALQQQAENVVAPALERIDGVASVSVSGGVERQITVTLDAQRAAGYGLSTSYITRSTTAVRSSPSPPTRSSPRSMRSPTSTSRSRPAARCASARSPTSPSRPPTATPSPRWTVRPASSYRSASAPARTRSRPPRRWSRRWRSWRRRTAPSTTPSPMSRANTSTSPSTPRSRASSSASCLRRSWCGCSCAAAARP